MFCGMVKKDEICKSENDTEISHIRQLFVDGYTSLFLSELI